MFTVKIEPPRNALSIAYRERVSPDETRRCAEEVRLALADLRPGYRLVVDLTGLDAMDVSCSPFIAEIMEMCNAAEVAEVIRIIPDPTRDIGLQILSFSITIPTSTSAPAAVVRRQTRFSHSVEAFAFRCVTPSRRTPITAPLDARRCGRQSHSLTAGLGHSRFAIENGYGARKR